MSIVIDDLQIERLAQQIAAAEGISSDTCLAQARTGTWPKLLDQKGLFKRQVEIESYGEQKNISTIV